MSRSYADDRGDDRWLRSSSRGASRHRRDSVSQDEGYPDAAGLPLSYMTAASGAHERLAYDPNVPIFPPPPNASSHSLQVPAAHHRPRSQPPATSADRADLARRGSGGSDRSGRSSRGDRSDNSDRSDRSDRSPSPGRRSRAGSRGPVGKVKHAADKTFSTSASGLGVGVLGALVGGFAAREASEAASRVRDKRDGASRHRPHNSKEHQRATLISTIVGAAVGGLGANAIEKRIEHRRQDRDHKPRALEPGSRGISDRSLSRSRGRGIQGTRGSGDSDDEGSDWESSGGRHGRGRRDDRERNLVISRSPSADLSRSRSRSRSRSHAHRTRHGGSGGEYYKTATSYDGRGDYR